jgi:tetratricopeptide (TPR) repeat protein
MLGCCAEPRWRSVRCRRIVFLQTSCCSAEGGQQDPCGYVVVPPLVPEAIKNPMKRLFDKLLARQQRLLSQLDAPEPVPVTNAGSTRPNEAERARRADEESSALGVALQALESGDIAVAKKVLHPFAQDAALVRTLTTLSRVLSAEGDFDEALELLKRAERLDPSDRKVWRLLAEACALKGLHTDEVRYRRQLAYVDAGAPAQSFVELIRSIHRASPTGVERNLNEIRTASKRVKNAPDLTTEVHVKFAEALYAFGPPHAKEARAHYTAANPCGPDERDVSARWIRPLDWCDQHGAKLTRWNEGGVPAHRPAIAELSDVQIFPCFQWTPVLDEGKVALSGYMVNRPQLRSEEVLTPLLMQTKKHLELRLPTAVPTIEQPALLLGGVNQYYHNTVECLSSLAIAETLGIATNLPLVVNDDLAPFQLEQLALLGYREDRLIRVRSDRPVRFSRLFAPTRLVRGGRWLDPLVPKWYRQRLVTSAASGKRRLYIARCRK